MSSSQKTMIRDFTNGNVAKQLIVFATPLFLSNLLQVVYNMVDMMVVGKFVGQVGLSAVSIGGDISSFLTFLSIGFANAGQVIMSQLIGSGQREKVGRFVGTMCTFLGLVAIGFTVLGLIFRTQLLQIMNTPEASFSQALSYSVTCTVGLIFIYGYNVVSAILRGMGDSKHPFIFISMAAIINIILDIVFVKYMALGAFGAALATVIGQTFSFISAVIFLIRKRDTLGFHISLSCFGIDKEMLGRLLKLGLPMAIKQASVQFSKLFVNSWINSYGVEVSAVAGIGHKINNIANLISNSINTAGSSMVGQNIGAGKYNRVTKILVTSFTITISISLILAAVMFFFPEQIFSLFADDLNMVIAMQFVPVAYVIFASTALRSPMNALINGSGNYKINFICALLDGIIMRIGLAVLLAFVFDLGYVGLWFGDAIAGFTPFVLGSIYYLTGTWKTRKYVVKDSD
ncbi:MAG: MATE family efflux transporter [Oscillospiraceae bacterium]